MATTELDKMTVEKYIEAYLYSDMDRFLSEVMRAFESRLKDCVQKVCSDLEAKVFRQEASDKFEVRVFFNGREEGKEFDS